MQYDGGHWMEDAVNTLGNGAHRKQSSTTQRGTRPASWPRKCEEEKTKILHRWKRRRSQKIGVNRQKTLPINANQTKSQLPDLYETAATRPSPQS